MISNLEKLHMRSNGSNSQFKGGNEWLYQTLPQCPSSTVPGFPRSAFEAVHDDSSKFRQLPCRTHISVGVCPYREKCVFLHDPRCVCPTAKSITRLKTKNRDDTVADSLYWPAMPQSMVMAHLDTTNRPRPQHNVNPYDHHHEDKDGPQPHVVQPYCVPIPQTDQYNLHDSSVYSVWMHFIDFCLASANSVNTTTSAANQASTYAYQPNAAQARAMASEAASSALCYAAVDVSTNPYTRRARLQIFQVLCKGQSASLLPVAPIVPRHHNTQPHAGPQQSQMNAMLPPQGLPGYSGAPGGYNHGHSPMMPPAHAPSSQPQSSRLASYSSSNFVDPFAPAPQKPQQAAPGAGRSQPMPIGGGRTTPQQNGFTFGAPSTSTAPSVASSLLSGLSTSARGLESVASSATTTASLLTSAALLDAAMDCGAGPQAAGSSSMLGRRDRAGSISPISVMDGATSLESSSNSSECDYLSNGLLTGDDHGMHLSGSGSSSFKGTTSQRDPMHLAFW